ncbi:STAS domain-containing protein [Actinoplanes sp. NPDC020271]|uniref:STAS domain-containing protein n=1 Tax=Actinoplanes sp. NPDC020271 TaxID=3363896 RepID=UPI0037B118F2
MPDLGGGPDGAVHQRRSSRCPPVLSIQRRSGQRRRVLSSETPGWGHRSFYDGNRCVVALHGELDMADVADLHGLLADALSHASSVVLDLSAVAFIDSTVINTLIKTHQAASAAGSHFAVANATRQVHRVLAMTGVLPTLSAAGHTAD